MRLAVDLQWIPQLTKEFQKIYQNSYREMGLLKSTPLDVCRRLSESYHRFLFLVKSDPSLGHKLAPPVSIDLLWHAHQSTPHLYQSETQRIVGFRLDHEPWPEETKKLREVDQDFACRWKTAFGTELERDHLFKSDP
jgi:hypothetical protein